MKFRIGTSTKVFFLLLDAVAIMAAAALLSVLRFGGDEATPWGLWAAVTLLPALAGLYVFGTYSFEEVRRQRMLGLQFLLALAAGATLSFMTIYVLRLPVSGLFGRGLLLGTFGLGFFLSFMARLAEFSWVRRNQRAQKILFCGAEASHGNLRKAIDAVGYRGEIVRGDVPATKAAALDVDLLLLDRHWKEMHPEAFRRALQWRFEGILVVELPSFYEAVFQKVNVDEIDESWFLSFDGFDLVQSRWQKRVKRLIDFTLSLLLGIVAGPVVAIAGFFVWAADRGPMFYRQKRTGLDGRDFSIVKLRSMRTDAEKTGAQWTQEKDPRITPFGNFLRKSRIDELPQLWNVLKGEMSFVGPRPERPEFNEMLEQKIPFYGARHVMPPGITGWAQVMYPYGASVEDSKEKLQFDLFYVKNYSLLLDLKILTKTARVVFLGRGR